MPPACGLESDSLSPWGYAFVSSVCVRVYISIRQRINRRLIMFRLEVKNVERGAHDEGYEVYRLIIVVV